MKYVANATQENVDRGLDMIVANGGKVSRGHASGGSYEFEVKGMKGNYSFDGEKIVVSITKKPRMVTEALIKAKLDSIFL